MQTMIILYRTILFQHHCNMHAICRLMEFVDYIAWATVNAWKSKTSGSVSGLVVSISLQTQRENTIILQTFQITFLSPWILFDYIFFILLSLLLWRLVWSFSFLPSHFFATVIVAFIEPSLIKFAIIFLFFGMDKTFIKVNFEYLAVVADAAHKVEHL